MGRNCDQPCPKSTYGPGCLKHCICMNNGTCDANGKCSCVGFTGPACEFLCPFGYYGPVPAIAHLENSFKFHLGLQIAMRLSECCRMQSDHREMRMPARVDWGSVAFACQKIKNRQHNLKNIYFKVSKLSFDESSKFRCENRCNAQTWGQNCEGARSSYSNRANFTTFRSLPV